MTTPASAADEALKLLPDDLSKIVGSVMHVYQGNHEHLPELLSNAGTVLLKIGRRFSTRQLLVLGGLLAVGALLIVRQATDDDDEETAPTGARNGEHRAASHDKP